LTALVTASATTDENDEGEDRTHVALAAYGILHEAAGVSRRLSGR